MSLSEQKDPSFILMPFATGIYTALWDAVGRNKYPKRLHIKNGVGPIAQSCTLRVILPTGFPLETTQVGTTKLCLGQIGQFCCKEIRMCEAAHYAHLYYEGLLLWLETED